MYSFDSIMFPDLPGRKEGRKDGGIWNQEQEMGKMLRKDLHRKVHKYDANILIVIDNFPSASPLEVG